MLDCTFRFNEINNKLFIPFEINDSAETPMTEIDPDIQFYSNSQYTHDTNCDYFFEDTFIKYLERNIKENTTECSLSMLHMNIRSMPKHYMEFEMYIESLKHDFTFIGISETWFHKDNCDLYGLTKYSSIDKFRNNEKGGGVTLFIRESVAYKCRGDLDIFDNQMETIFIEVEKENFGLASNMVIGLVYRIPDSSVDSFNEQIANVLDTISREGKLCYLMGDMNIDLLKHECHKPTSTYLDIMYSNNLFPVITKPTRITEKSATLIDHIFTNNFDHDCQHIQGILCTDISDHYPIFYIAKTTKPSCSDQLYYLRRKINQKTSTKFIEKISSVDWNFITDVQDPQEAYTLFHKTTSDMYNLCFPYEKIIKKYDNRKPWLTTELKERIKIKNKLFAKRKSGTQAKEKCLYYNMYRNKLNHLLRSTERKHYQELLQDHRNNLRKSWQIIKSVINKRKYKPVNTRFLHNGSVIDDKSKISNKFNNFFVNIGTSLASKIPNSNKQPSEFIKVQVTDSMYLNPVTENEVEKILGNLKDSAAGWDDIKPNLVKMVKSYIKTPLTHICNLSLSQGIFPEELKIANVLPLFKNGDEMIFSNYRPVSILPVFSKLFEKIMYNRLLDFVNKHGVIYEYQFGFLKGKSTFMALISLLEKISAALDKGEFVIGIFLDFSKAFDTVDHDILLKKLEIYGVRGIVHDWFRSYLTNRSQYVTYNMTKSNKLTINCGVPQGSILGPLLFLIYINDLSTVSSALFSILFADDTNMFDTGKDINLLSKKINEELIKIQEWLRCNKLSLNVSKTHYMIFCPSQKVVNDVRIVLDNELIDRVYVTKFLGVQIDYKLSWSMHIEYTCKKLSKCIGILCKARRQFDKSTLVGLYYSFVYPYLIYCNHVWGNTYPTALQKMFILQKKIMRIISCVGYRTSTSPLFMQHKLLTLKCINMYIVATFMYECVNGNAPHMFKEYFTVNRNVHSHNTRQLNHLHIVKWHLNIRKFSFRVHGAQLWNSIPLNIRESKSLNIFKSKMKRYLLELQSSE